MNREEWVNKGFVDEPVDKSIDLKAAINELKKEKNAVILGHYYQKGEIQDIADYIGDSLALAQIAAKTGYSCDVWRSFYGRNRKGALSGQEGAGARLECRMFVGRQLSGR